MSVIVHGTDKVASPTLTFTGKIYLNMIYMSPDYPKTPAPEINTAIANVTFTPGARTYWHKHKFGQFIHVTAGSGWICDRGGEKQRIRMGDKVYCKAGTEHWHGADQDTVMTHFQVALGGAVSRNYIDHRT